jgi:ribosome-binding factor A
MEDLVAQARAADALLADVREGAEPAGDPDPYRPAPGAAEDDTADRSDLPGADLPGGIPGGGPGAGHAPA